MTAPKNTGHSWRALERQYKFLSSKLNEVLSECYTGDVLQDELARQIRKHIAELDDAAIALEDEFKSRD